MFLVQQMLETKQEEIERLAEHATMREDGLTCSENMLETDTKAFLKFFNDIRDKTTAAQNQLDQTRRKKNEKTNELRRTTESISVVVSNITKHIEMLDVYNKYKVFLDSLPNLNISKEEKEQIEQDERRKKEQREFLIREKSMLN